MTSFFFHKKWKKMCWRLSMFSNSCGKNNSLMNHDWICAWKNSNIPEFHNFIKFHHHSARQISFKMHQCLLHLPDTCIGIICLLHSSWIFCASTSVKKSFEVTCLINFAFFPFFWPPPLCAAKLSLLRRRQNDERQLS